MKKLSLLFFLISISVSILKGQQIVSFTISPPYPTTADSVTIIVACEFPYGGCDGSAYPPLITGNEITCDAIHCLGMLAFICDESDTIVIPPLASGHYNFTFTLVTQDGTPCSSGTYLDKVDSVQFTVTNANLVPEYHSKNIYSVVPNPTKGKIEVWQDRIEKLSVKIFSLTGTLMGDYTIHELRNDIDLPLTSGIYTVVIENSTQRFITRIQVVD